MKKLVLVSSEEALEIRSALLVYIKSLSKHAHSQYASSDSSSKALDRIDISEAIINKLNRLFFN